ncbi:hypothetical protein [Luedemannella helvata]|uniref:Uncharacterized protein n=1 Tax=Luedemannella helvata TaxID=349315 RepID=A0ABN2JYV8_9ACTN
MRGSRSPWARTAAALALVAAAITTSGAGLPRDSPTHGAAPAGLSAAASSAAPPAAPPAGRSPTPDIAGSRTPATLPVAAQSGRDLAVRLAASFASMIIGAVVLILLRRRRAGD